MIHTILAPGAPWPFSFSDSGISVNAPEVRNHVTGKSSPKTTLVLDYLKTQNDFVSVAHIADALSMTYTRTQDALKRLRCRGLLVCTKKPAVTRCGHVGIVGFYMAGSETRGNK